MKRFLFFLLLFVSFTMTAEAKHYTDSKQDSDSVSVVKVSKSNTLYWSRYVYVNRKDDGFRVYFLNGEPVYIKSDCIRKVPKRVRKQIYEHMERSGRLLPINKIK